MTEAVLVSVVSYTARADCVPLRKVVLLSMSVYAAMSALSLGVILSGLVVLSAIIVDTCSGECFNLRTSNYIYAI